jgi:hypothetical protein
MLLLTPLPGRSSRRVFVHHNPAVVKKLKQKEFLALKQGNMTVSEYLDEFRPPLE